MSLQEIMSQADLAFYPQVALVIFAAVFVVISARLLASSKRAAAYEEAAEMPLQELAPTGRPGKEPA